MMKLTGHDLSDRIKHEVSGMGRITKMTGDVLDNGYTDPVLVDARVEVDGKTVACVSNPDGTIGYFDRYGQEIDLPAPVSFADPVDFTSQVANLVEKLEDQRAKQKVRYEKTFNRVMGTALAITIAGFIFAWVNDSPGPLFGAIGLFFAACVFTPSDPGVSSMGPRVLRKIPVRQWLDDEEWETFQTQLSRFASQFGIAYSGSLHGATTDDIGHLVFQGKHQDHNMVEWFTVNHSATAPKFLEYYSEHHFHTKQLHKIEAPARKPETATV